MFPTVDIELTNRCNAKCHFCPRDATPHQGLMTVEVFEQAFARTVELRDTAYKLDSDITVSLCGLGEPLLNRHAVEFTGRLRDAGFECAMSTNAALLDEERAHGLLDAGLRKIYINAGDEGEEYEAVYRLPFERTRENIVRFVELSRGRCEVYVVLVDHRRDLKHRERMEAYWRDHGVDLFVPFDVINRGGALFVDHMQFESYPEIAEARALLQERGVEPLCPTPFLYLFVGYDGLYYLCCSDWRKQAPLGSIFDESFMAVTRQKLLHVTSREPVCKTCNHDPLNQLTEVLRGVKAGELDASARDAMVEEFANVSRAVRAGAAALEQGLPETPARGKRRRIPVVAAE